MNNKYNKIKIKKIILGHYLNVLNSKFEKKFTLVLLPVLRNSIYCFQYSNTQSI